ncbi:MAG: tetratricopeptide repeat protein, partial [Alphaproteobacteria bacterium]
AQFMLGKAYAAGNGVNRDVDKADSWFRKAVKSGGYRHSRVGGLYAEGKGVPRNITRGRRWYEDGARAGDRYSLLSLGLLYQYGDGVPVDYDKAFDYYTRALAAGAVPAHDTLAEMYRLGQGRPVDWERAVHHMKAAAVAGSPMADLDLGNYYSNAELGGHDLALAERHYLRSARSGDLIGLHELGSFYRNELRKPRQALKWWKVAMRKGMFHLADKIGDLYADGLLPAEDAEATALAWYIVAVENDTDYTKPKVAALKGRLDRERRGVATRQAAEIRAEFGLRSPPRTGS